VQLWQTSDGKLLHAWCAALPANGRIIDAAFATNSQTLVTASAAGTLQVWRVDNGALLRSVDLPAEKIVSLAFAPDGQTVAAGVDDGARVQLFRIEDGQLLRTIVWNASGAMRLVFSPDGQLLAIGMETGGVGISRVADGKWLLGSGFQQSVVPEMAFALDSRTLAVGLVDRTVQFFQLDGRLSYVLDLRSKVAFAMPTPGYPPPQPPTPTTQATMVPQQFSVYSAFAPDGQTLVASLEDGTIQFWHIQHGTLLRELGGEATPGHSRLTFAPDGKFLAVATEASTIDLWGIPQ
jgi:WD40 repeat protein